MAFKEVIPATELDIYVFINTTESISLFVSPGGYRLFSSECFGTDTVYQFIYFLILQFLNHLITIKTKEVLIHQASITLPYFAYTV